MSYISRRQLLLAAGGGVVSVLFSWLAPRRRSWAGPPVVAATYELVIIDGTIWSAGRLGFAAPPTALELLRQATGQTVATARHESLGFLVTGIGAVHQTAGRYWYYWVNRQWTNVGAGQRMLTPGDQVIWILAPQASPWLFVRGDANGDGVLDVSDPITTLFHLYRGKPLPCADAADADDDGQVRLNDSLVLFNALFRGGPLPPAPYPWPGLDPTADRLGCAR